MINILLDFFYSFLFAIGKSLAIHFFYYSFNILMKIILLIIIYDNYKFYYRLLLGGEAIPCISENIVKLIKDCSNETIMRTTNADSLTVNE